MVQNQFVNTSPLSNQTRVGRRGMCSLVMVHNGLNKLRVAHFLLSSGANWLETDDFVEQNIAPLSNPNGVVAVPGISRNDDRAILGIKPKCKCRSGGMMIDQNRRYH